MESMLGLARRPSAYRRLTGRPFRRVHDRIVADVTGAGLVPGQRILDVGTGPGDLALTLARALPGVRVDGIDRSADMIAYATRTAEGRATFTAADAAHMPYPDGTFDLVVSSMSRHHWADAPGVLAEIRRVLAPAGRAWIYDARIALGKGAEPISWFFGCLRLDARD